LSAWALWAQPRIVSLSSPQTETIYALGAQAEIVGVSDVCTYPDQVIADRRSGRLRELGAFTKPDYALIDQLHPDLILTGTTFQTEIAAKLRAKGYRVLHFEPHSLADVFHEIDQIGAAVGKPEEAAKLSRSMRAEYLDIAQRASTLPRVRVYMELNHEGPWTTGCRSALNDIIIAAGGENIFGDRDEGVFVASQTEIVHRNPEVILSPIWVDAHVGGLKGIIPLAQIIMRPGYQTTSAVKNSRVLYYDSTLLKHDGPRQILAIKKLAYLLYPEAFENPANTIPWELGRIRP
jgi:iron complex transport system substrate-binding protein